MSNKNLRRREFLKTCATAAVAAAGSGPLQKLFAGETPQAYEANLPRKIAKDADLVVVADCDGKVVGTIIGGYDEWWAWIYRVAVHPEYQRRGIATGLFNEIHQRLAALGADSACLFTSPSNEYMRALLAKIGYKERTDRRFGFVFESSTP